MTGRRFPDMDGMVFNIQRFSIHDGPGIRTTVFLKGCNLRCFWCHNPESLQPEPQLQVFPQKCIGCGKCLEVCPLQAHQLIASPVAATVAAPDQAAETVAGTEITASGNTATLAKSLSGRKIFLRERCTGCGKCAETCYAGALVLTGKKMTVEEVVAEIEKDRPFYENSGGGATFSGGEPLLQSDFLAEALEACRRKGIHTAVDTAGNVPWPTFRRVLPLTDLFLFDMKTADPALHRRATGVTNTRILKNLACLAAAGTRIHVRIPVIPGMNDSPEEMAAMADILAGIPGLEKVELLPFHRLGGGKYESLGMTYRAAALTAPEPAALDSLAALFRDRNLPLPCR